MERIIAVSPDDTERSVAGVSELSNEAIRNELATNQEATAGTLKDMQELREQLARHEVLLSRLANRRDALATELRGRGLA